MLHGMARATTPTPVPDAVSCCAKCGTGGALLVNAGVKLCPAHWWERYGVYGPKAPTSAAAVPARP